MQLVHEPHIHKLQPYAGGFDSHSRHLFSLAISCPQFQPCLLRTKKNKNAPILLKSQIRLMLNELRLSHLLTCKLGKLRVIFLQKEYCKTMQQLHFLHFNNEIPQGRKKLHAHISPGCPHLLLAFIFPSGLSPLHLPISL